MSNDNGKEIQTVRISLPNGKITEQCLIKGAWVMLQVTITLQDNSDKKLNVSTAGLVL